MSRKKTNEQYIEELKVANPNVVSLERYINANVPILHKCLIDKYEWKARPSNLLNGRVGCPKCSQRFRRTNEDYINEIHEKIPYIEPLENFKGMGVPILHLCKKHNIKWKATPDNIFKGHGCKECGNVKIGLKNKRKHEEYVKELKEKRPNIAALEKYIDALTPIKHQCIIDGYVWIATPASILSKSGCPKCAGNIKYTTETYTTKLKEICSTLIPSEEYINMTTPIWHKCQKHNINLKTSPSSALQGSGCPLCTKEKQKIALGKTNEQYIKELKEINSHIIPLEEYINALTPIKHKCLIDDYIWNVRPSQVLRGFGCPKCKRSKGEIQIEKWLVSHNINYEPQKRFSNCKDKRSLPFDFYLPDYNCAIEYQGKQHYQPINFFGGLEKFTYQQYHDELKKEYCKKEGISLLCIPFNKNIEEELDNFLS